ncbi:UNVERIFIED_CONTAM: hypothetical protein PYX00_006026 [Menopon gallinae]|uniref:Gustatory receptor n=1 Tax=Menopon gallinae TaxID=328185 RepID=A0AAW2HVJ4_9NEOP
MGQLLVERKEGNPRGVAGGDRGGRKRTQRFQQLSCGISTVYSTSLAELIQTSARCGRFPSAICNSQQNSRDRYKSQQEEARAAVVFRTAAGMHYQTPLERFTLLFFGFSVREGRFRLLRGGRLALAAQTAFLVISWIYFCHGLEDLRFDSFTAMFYHLDGYGFYLSVILFLSMVMVKSSGIAFILNGTVSLQADLRKLSETPDAKRYLTVTYGFLAVNLLSNVVLCSDPWYGYCNWCGYCNLSSAAFCHYNFMVVLLFCVLTSGIERVHSVMNRDLMTVSLIRDPMTKIRNLKTLRSIHFSVCSIGKRHKRCFGLYNLITAMVEVVMTVNLFTVFGTLNYMIRICWIFSFCWNVILRVYHIQNLVKEVGI